MQGSSILKRPVITEKSMKEIAKNRYTFAVDVQADKPAIRQAVKELFSVDAINVRTITVPGKRRRIGRRRMLQSLSSWKKAIVTVKEGQSIDLFTLQATKEKPS